MKKHFYLTSLLALYISVGFAQRITDVRAQATGNLITISYDLAGTILGQLYEVAIYSSHDGMSKPLQHVRGDIGASLTPGRGKRIEWGVKKELGDFDGDITFEIRARLMFSPIRFTTPTRNVTYKRGNTYKIDWLGAVADENMKIELYNDTTKRFDITQVQNRYRHQWTLPENMEPDKNYRLKISSVNKPDNFAWSSNFTVRRKVPLGMKLVPLGVVGGVAAFLFLNDGGAGGAAADGDLPLPPDPE